MRFLKDAEVAERLCCSLNAAIKLRKAGKLPYIPGRPVLIDERDLTAYIEAKRKIPIYDAPIGPPSEAELEYRRMLAQEQRRRWHQYRLRAKAEEAAARRGR